MAENKEDPKTWESVLTAQVNYLIDRVKNGRPYETVKEEILKVGRAFDQYKSRIDKEEDHHE